MLKDLAIGKIQSSLTMFQIRRPFGSVLNFKKIMHVDVWPTSIYVHYMHACLMPEERVRPLETRIPDSCEPPRGGMGIELDSLQKQPAPFTTEPAL